MLRWFFIVLIIFASNCFGQQLQIHFKDSSIAYGLFANKNEIYQKLEEEKVKSITEGYFEWSLDSISFGDTTNAYIYKGPQFKWESLEWRNPHRLNSKISKTNFEQRVFNPEELTLLVNNLLGFYANHGYPFAQIAFDSLQINKNKISANIQIDKGPEIKYDTLAINGNITISKTFLQQVLEIEPGSPFNQSNLDKIQKKLQNLPYLKQKQAPRIIFNNNIATINLFLESRSANFLNGIVGVLPNTNVDPRGSTGNNLIITGDVELKVFNTFHLGEKFAAKWKRLQAQSQELTLDFNARYLFGTPIGVDESFDLLKQDTSFINFNNKIGLNYSTSPSSFASFFWDHQSSTILLKNPNFNNNAATSNLFGFSLNSVNYDYQFNPTKGYGIELSFSAGNKSINGTEEDGKITIDVPDNLLDVASQILVPKSSRIFKLEGHVNYFWKVAQLSTIKTSLQGAWIINDYLFDNELIRIGGFSSLRGFDERSIFASNYAFMTLEYRFLLEQNSFLFGFIDQARVERTTLFETSEDYPTAFGAGISFETNAGIFTVSYALGRQLDNPIQFRSAKIHFGFTSLF